ncbi:hypothetical protein GGI20_001388 [Coemansia sp. BCRC 34301]|nr:hypothetical protein GGI20_001388 [Coemansia sp. BCRC 34301]
MTTTMPRQPCSRPLTLVLHSAAAPRSASGLAVKPCIKRQISATTALPLAQAAPVPRFVHFDTQLEHTRLFFKSDSPKHAACDPAPAPLIHAAAVPLPACTAAKAFSLTSIRRTRPSFLPYEDASVVLESVEPAGLALAGSIKVHNLAYEKEVAVRLTMDGWKTFEDVPATYLRSVIGTDGSRPGVDRFAFAIPCPPILAPTTISMCVSYKVNGQMHWDNNRGSNYSFVLTPNTAASAATPAKPTAHSFTRGFDAPPSGSTSTNSMSSVDTRRYMRYSEARFSATAPTHSSPQLPTRTPSPIMRTGSPLATSYVWAPCSAALLQC